MGILVYWENQDAALCGVHCLNALLQGGYFTEVDLANIAHELDAKERAAMAEQGFDTPEFLKFMAEDSGNVDESGNYSIQVLSEALKSFGLDCETTRGLRVDPLTETGFICNLKQHWFALRRIQGHWIDLNSIAKAPNHLSDFYITLYLDTLRQKGYEVYVIRGSFPALTDITSTDGHIAEVRIPQSASARAEPEMDEDEDLAAAIALSMGQDSSTMPSPAGAPVPQTFTVADDFEDDPELAAAIAASLQ